MDTERRVTQLDGDVHEIYGLLEKVDQSVLELRGRTDMAVVSSEVTGLDAKLDQVLALLASSGRGSPSTMPE
jgi:hypothetical protein